MLNKKSLLRAAGVCILTAALGALALIYGCAAKVPATGTTPGRTGTPIEQALAYNASLADANLSVAQAVIQAQGAGLISVDDANRVTTAQSLIADGDRQLTGVLQTVAMCVKNAGTLPSSVQACKTPAAQVQRILAQISTAANNLVKGPDLGIKDAATKKTILDSLNSVLTLAGNITQSLSGAGVLQ